MRYLAWASLRSHELCGKIRDCEQALTVQCQGCNTVWAPPDIRMPDGCPSCGTVAKYNRMRCDDCPVTVLENCMESDAGRLFSRAAQIAAMLEHGVRWGVDELLANEYAAVEHIWNEQNRYRRDQANKPPPPTGAG